MKRAYYSLQILMLLTVGVSAFYFSRFTADDAYITYRYAENWVTTGSLVYNIGEPINAMTSPLHAMLSAAVFLVTRNTVDSNKILAVILLMISTVLVWSRYKGHVHLQALAIILLIPSCVLLWTFGGLETPVLLFLVTLTVVLALRPPPFELKMLYLVFFLAGLAFLARYDSMLFFLPLCVYVGSRARSLRNLPPALIAGAILPLVWLFVSLYYYGDLLPTSFYVKTPNGGLWNLIFNARYVASYLLFVGIIPVVILVFALLAPKHKVTDVLLQHFKSAWWLYIGLLMELLYGLTVATLHMMFSFRFFVPYIPASVILVVDIVGRASETRQVDLSARRPAYLFTGFLFSLMLFQLFQYVYTYNHSVDGIFLDGEYRSLGVRDYARFMQILKQEASDIQNHWTKIDGSGDRRPRIITFAGGMLPYAYRDAYIYEKLVSYRHCYRRFRQALYADYINILAPRQGSIDQQLPRPEATYQLVSSYEMSFDGSPQEFLVYYNPAPEPNNLSSRISAPCDTGEQAAR